MAGRKRTADPPGEDQKERKKRAVEKAPGKNENNGRSRTKKVIQDAAPEDVKKPAKTRKKMGRPQVEIDKEVFEGLCGLMCTEEEIAGWFKCSVNTVNNWCQRNYLNEDGKPMTFFEVLKRFSAVKKASLRRQMFKSAEAGNVTMQIFLAKTQLGMREEFALDVNTDDVQIYLPENGRKR